MIYFDHAAALRTPDELAIYELEMRQYAFANQEAGHYLGYEMRKKIADSTVELAQKLGNPGLTHAVFADSASALFFIAFSAPYWQGKRILSTRIEHPALLRNLAKQNLDVTFTELLPDGRIDIEHLPDGNFDVLATHLVQSEIGVIQPFAELVRKLKERNNKLITFCDAVQAVNKVPLVQTDVIVCSGHKLGAPGAAAMLTNLAELEKHANFLRKHEYAVGRPDPAAIMTLARAADFANRADKISAINRYLRETLAGAVPKLRFTVSAEHSSPYILHFVLPGYESGVVIRMLSERRIYAASSSACSSESNAPSTTLTALKFPKNEAFAGMRLSFGYDTLQNEAEQFVTELIKVLKEY